jgi:hypothetical protein
MHLQKSTHITHDLNLILTSDRHTIQKAGRNVVVILVSDETHSSPRYSADILATFKQYVPPIYAPRIYPIPLGCINSFQSAKIKPPHERFYDLCFVGHIHPSRLDFQRELQELADRNRYRMFIAYTNPPVGFRLTVGEYSAILHDSKIALCPSGIISSESFRVFEAARAGCTVITTPKPSTWFYDSFPGVTLPSWRNLNSVLANVLSSESMLKVSQERHLWWWSDICSEVPVGRYIEQTLTAILAGQ